MEEYILEDWEAAKLKSELDKLKLQEKINNSSDELGEDLAIVPDTTAHMDNPDPSKANVQEQIECFEKNITKMKESEPVVEKDTGKDEREK